MKVKMIILVIYSCFFWLFVFFNLWAAFEADYLVRLMTGLTGEFRDRDVLKGTAQEREVLGRVRRK